MFYDKYRYIIIDCIHWPFNSQDLIVNSPLELLHISLSITYKNLMLDHDNNFYLICLSFLIAKLWDDVWML